MTDLEHIERAAKYVAAAEIHHDSSEYELMLQALLLSEAHLKIVATRAMANGPGT